MRVVERKAIRKEQRKSKKKVGEEIMAESECYEAGADGKKTRPPHSAVLY